MSNSWIEFVKNIQKERNLSYKDALIVSKDIYIKGGSVNNDEKQRVLNIIKPITKEQAEKRYIDLIKDKEIPAMTSRKVNDFVDFFTFRERLETISRSGMSFWDLWENKSTYLKKQYVKNFIKYERQHGQNTLEKSFYHLFKVYHGSIGIFRPVVAMNIYDKFKPTSVLDFTMGWGGRLVGACALDIPFYTGIDLNKNLIKPYKNMVATLKQLGSKTNINLIFKDALKVDYSKLNYDMVLTSPPYYNTELYRGTDKLSNEEWEELFYKPLFTETYRNLKNGGYYILNVSISVYENVCVKLFGKATELIPINTERPNKANAKPHKEYIYVWKK